MKINRLVSEGPSVIGTMTAILQSGSSIDAAIRAVSVDGPDNSKELFTQAVRMIDTKGAPSLSEALRNLLDDLPKGTEGYTGPLNMVLSAADSPDPDTMSVLLSDAAGASLESVRIMGESYGSSLTVPCTTVFGRAHV